VGQAQHAGVTVETLPRDRFLAHPSCPAGCRSVFALLNYEETEGLEDLLDLPVGDRGILALDGITDPGNLGAMIRSAVWFGVTDLILPRNNAAALNEAVLLRSAGALAHARIYRVNNLVRALEQLKEAGYWILGTSLTAKEDLAGADLSGPLVMVIGSEGKGMRRLVEASCDRLVKLAAPRAPIGSLNASAFTAVLLYQRWLSCAGKP
jgi:23S rRNA (guanosine2251-2'-O)-methyltransferase